MAPRAGAASDAMKILVADDDSASRLIIETLLKRWGHDVLLASDGNETVAKLEAEPGIQALVLDWMMPGPDGPQICRKLRAEDRPHYVYVVMLTGNTSRDAFMEGMEAGADDYITKPLDTRMLRARLRVAERIVSLEEKLSKQNESLRQANEHSGTLLRKVRAQAQELERQSREDALTRLPNRRHLDIMLEREYSRSKRYGRPLSMAVADIDNFKRVNDLYSHSTGDEVLRTVADILRDNCRAGDVVGRFGGEEFVFMFPETNREHAQMACEKLRVAIESFPWEGIAEGLHTTITIGLTDGTDFETHEKMFAAADENLLEGKRRGKNMVCG